MQVTELLENVGKVKEKVVAIDYTSDNNTWANTYFKADYNKFIEVYAVETKQLVKEYNEFKRRFEGCTVPKQSQEELQQIQKISDEKIMLGYLSDTVDWRRALAEKFGERDLT